MAVVVVLALLVAILEIREIFIYRHKLDTMDRAEILEPVQILRAVEVAERAVPAEFTCPVHLLQVALVDQGAVVVPAIPEVRVILETPEHRDQRVHRQHIHVYQLPVEPVIQYLFRLVDK
jgi:hypothetical protein